MSDADSRGPQVDASEDLYRAIVVSDWWVGAGNPPRVSSLGFKVRSPFSVNVASLMTLAEAIRHMGEVLHRPEGAIVSFNCDDARSLEFDARYAPDPNTNNDAHANVYYDGTASSRKGAAKKLAERCRIEHKPSF